MSEQDWFIVGCLIGGVIGLLVLFAYTVHKEHHSTDKDML